jgi:hypothetical protein
LDKGQQLEIGSHEELLALGGRYAELFHLQAKGTGDFCTACGGAMRLRLHRALVRLETSQAFYILKL